MLKNKNTPPLSKNAICCVILAGAFSCQSLYAADYTFIGSGGPYNLNPGDSLTIQSGTFTHGINNFPSGVVIEVEDGASFKPSNINNAAGTLIAKPGSTVEIPGVAFMGGMVIDNSGDFTFKSNVNMNGMVSITNRAEAEGFAAPTMYFKSGYQLSNGSMIDNQGLMIFSQDFNTQNGTKLTNSGTMTMEAFNPSGEVINNGHLRTSKFINIDSGAQVTNNCTFVGDTGFNNNSDKTSNHGIIITTEPNSNIHINNAFYQSAAGYLQGAATGSQGFTNSSTVTGGGNYHFIGHTRNNGSFGIDSDTDVINFYDATPSNSSSFFDSQNSYPVNTTKNSIPSITADQAMTHCTYDSIFNDPESSLDYGDAPTSGASPDGLGTANYGEASHTITDGIYLGSVQPDEEKQNQPDINAAGDDENGAAPDDEDGVFIPEITRGEIINLSVLANGEDGQLQAWIDWNGNGDFSDAGEQIALNLKDNGEGDDITSGDGTIHVSVTVPSNATLNPTYARLRWSTSSDLAAVGSAPDGEVEDYMLTIKEDESTAACVIDDIGSSQYSSASPSASSRFLSKNTFIFEASFDSSDWSGKILAYNLTTENGEGGLKSVMWNSDTTVEAGNRSLFTYNPENAGGSGSVLNWDNLNQQQQSWFARTDGDLMGKARVEWLQGVALETAPGDSLRERTHLLGDIVNSSLTLKDQMNNFGYSSLSGAEGSGYSAFLASKLTKSPSLLFGTNDGMFHALNPKNGEEFFAYVPNEVIKHLPDFSNPKYGCAQDDCLKHKYTVDGVSTVSDAYLSNGWQSVVVGTLGLGGRGLFALNVTDPENFSESDILWEISSTQAPDNVAVFGQHLGNTLPSASIVRTKDGRWVTFVANGYDSESKQAVLFAIDVETGSLIKTFNTLSGSEDLPNGLSTPTVVDTDADSIADRVYAGDLLGNLWAIDISSADINEWGIAYGTNSEPEPFFRACESDSCSKTQAITAGPEIGRNHQGGLMIYVGTGKYFDLSDGEVDSSKFESFYGLQDNGVTISRSELVEQKILEEVTVTNDLKSRITSTNSVDYATKNGWFLDLLTPPFASTNGERVVSKAILKGNRIIFVTLEPSVAACEWGGDSWLMEVNALDGARLSTIPFDTNNDMAFNSADNSSYEGSPTIISGLQKDSLGLVRGAPVILKHTARTEGKYLSGSETGIEMFRESASELSGRMSWTNIGN